MGVAESEKGSRPLFSRREILSLTVASPLWAAVGQSGRGAQTARLLDRQALVQAPAYATRIDGARADTIGVVRDWNGSSCRARVVNKGRAPVPLKEIVLFDLVPSLPPTTQLYGEGFQMLTQTGGTVAQPVDYSTYTDEKHYRLRAGDPGRAFYGLFLLTPPGEDTRVMAFTSCARFSGHFRLQGSSLQAVLDAEGLEIGPNETWPLEEMAFLSGSDRSRLLADVATRLAVHHPPLLTRTPPAGWCSWYCFGPRVTAQQVLDNLDVIAKTIPSLKYVQIDDGYQAAMGDWLDTGAAFGGNVRTVLEAIRRRGFEPAIWVAPFVAEEDSRLFQQHRDWFIQDENGQPLRADRVTFGGWRRGPWYAVDGTHPEAQRHLEQVFRTMRQEWGCTYFKLDANFWGAMHGGRFHDRRATRVEAYRRGMQAILRGTGDAFVLGCNHPIWPSAGLIHGSRSSSDIRRAWDRFASTARQNLSRNWQNGRLWWNDPDAVVLSELTDAEVQFHATAIYASGGMVLSGDDLTSLPPARAAMLAKLLPPTGIAAQFEGADLTVGVVPLPKARMICLFNWNNNPETLSFRLPRPATVVDYWTGRSLGRHDGMMSVAMPPRSARLLECR